MAEKVEKVVIIGGSGGGSMAARMLRRLSASVEITILREKDEPGLLTRCALPYLCVGEVSLDACFKPDSKVSEGGIRLIDEKAQEINRSEKSVITETGRKLYYDKLILAMGARPFIPPIEGINLKGIFTLRKPNDALEIWEYFNRKRVKNIAIIGAGAIGVEMAYLMRKRGIKVYLIETLEHILGKVMDNDMVEELQKYMKEKGVEVLTSSTVEKFEGEKEVKTLLYKNINGESSEISIDMAIVNTGVRPNIELASKCGLEIGKFGIKVNKFLQTSDPDIYAIGDLIEYEHFITKSIITGQLRPNAVIGGRIAAQNIMGYNIEFPGYINSFTTLFFDRYIGSAGLTEAQAKKENIEIIKVIKKGFSKHSVMPDKKPYSVKLIFEKNSGKLIGGQIISNSKSVIRHIDLIALGIRCKIDAQELSTFRCAGQPELSCDPGMEPIALAAQEVFLTLKSL